MFSFRIEGGLTPPRQAAEARADGPGQAAEPTFADRLRTSPTLYPIATDPRRDGVQFIALTQAGYDAASFLDSRMLAPDVPSVWVRWADVRRATQGLSERCHFIFHISHVGSTLLSRLLGRHAAFFSLREPAILRTLADIHLALDQPTCPWSRAEFGERLGTYLTLWSRTFDPGQTAVIKATSFVCEMSDLLIDRVAESRSIFMYVSPPTFLKALLDGAMSDITGHGEKRLARLHRRLGTSHWQFENLSAGESVAMSWLSEMWALHATAARFPERVLWMDFDRFLADPEAGLAAALKHLGATDEREAARNILAGPTMGQYAKAPAYKFDAQVREQILRQGEERHAPEIRKGLDWLDRAATAFPAIAEVIESAAKR